MSPDVPGSARAEIDFSDEECRALLERAHTLIVQAYELLVSLGVARPADNQFLREALLCARAGLIWSGARGEADAVTAAGVEVEVRSTVYVPGRPLSFPTSRDVKPRVIDRWRQAGFWLFGIFDPCERLLAHYRVPAAGMAPLLDDLEERMRRKLGAGRTLNNPHLPFGTIRAAADAVWHAPGVLDRADERGKWVFEPTRGL